jgi:7-cyano-7-deazaguanine synthase in queuosine biosynthesis
MSTLTPTGFLRVSEEASIGTGTDLVAVLGRDIRTSSEKIASYCVMNHKPIYEDLATLVESMAFLDRRIVRKRSSGWPRQLSIQVPVYEHSQLRRTAATEALVEAVRFLTGDQWSFEFVTRKGPAPNRQGALSLPQAAMKHVVPFSDRLDSFAQARLSIREHGQGAVMLVRSGLGRDRISRKRDHELVRRPLRIPRKFGGGRMGEASYRTRPLVFYTLAAIGADITRAGAVVIGESGQGAIGPACLPFADEWWFRSAHPAFIKRWAHFLGIILGQPIRFEHPQLWKTKGEVLARLQADGLMAGWEQTSSCSARPNDRHGRRGCGFCGGCLLRAVSIHAAGLTLPAGDNAFDLYASEDVARDRGGREMTSGERAIAVRAIATMVGFARLADSSEGALAIQREARLVDPVDSTAAQTRLLRLVKQHQAEWNAFVSSLPQRSWVREIVDQL